MKSNSIRLAHPYTILVEPPFLSTVDKDTGLIVPYNDGLPKIYARVVQCHPTCEWTKPGDVITFPSNSYENYLISGNKTIYAMDERAVIAIIEDWA